MGVFIVGLVFNLSDVIAIFILSSFALLVTRAFFNALLGFKRFLLLRNMSAWY